MPEDQTPAATQADTAGDTSAQAATTTSSDTQAESEPISLDEAKKLRAEAKALRNRLKAFEDKQAADEQAKLSEQERLAKELADAKSTHDGLVAELVDREVRLQAAELGVAPRNLKYVAKMIWDELEFDNESGMPTNVGTLVKNLLKEVDLTDKRAPATAGGATSPSRSATTGVGQITMESIAAMTAEQYNQMSQAQRDEVTRVLLNRSRR